MPSARPSSRLPAAVGIGDRVEADIAEARLAFADDDRGAVDQDPVDQIGGEESGGGGRAALDQQVVDVMKSIHILPEIAGFPSRRPLRRESAAPAAATVLQAPAAARRASAGRRDRCRADQDHVAMRAFEVDMGAGILAGDPFRSRPRQRDLAVDRQASLSVTRGRPSGGAVSASRRANCRRRAFGRRPLHLDPGFAKPR